MNIIQGMENGNRYNFIFKASLYLLFLIALFSCSDDKDNDQKATTPVDIIVLVDNSADMSEEIQGLQDNLNANLAELLSDKNLDYRIILIGRYGLLNDESVCIEAPLSGISDCSNPPTVPINSDRFFHYSIEVNSNNSLCTILETLQAADEFNLASNGWINWLRTSARKVFIEITTDGVNCFSGELFDDANNELKGSQVANAFHTALVNLSPTQFGSQSNPNYRFFSLIGMPNKNANNPALPFTTFDPISLSKCATATNAGTGYQGLSILTDGFRFSVCQVNEYDLIFEAMANEIIDLSSQ